MANRKPTQLKLGLKPKYSHGGARPGAGRPKKPGSQVCHAARERISARTPLHLTLKLRSGMVSLRSVKRLNAFARAAKCAAEHGLRIQQFSLQSNHLHLIAEAENNWALSKGMQSLAVSLARDLMKSRNARKGRIFFGRYHLHVLKTPREVKNAIRYVLANASRHEKLRPYLDVFSSAWHFQDWETAFDKKTLQRLSRGLKEPPRWMAQFDGVLSPAKSWLQREGWKLRSA